MAQLKKILRKSRATLGFQIALAMLVPAKGKASSEVRSKSETDDLTTPPQDVKTAPPQLTGRWDFSRLFTVAAHPEIIQNARENANAVHRVAHNVVRLAAHAARHANHQKNGEKKSGIASASFTPKPMTHEEIRLWLQSFNAGPYACLKYKGDVPYKETQDYVPRVLRAYEQNLPDTYDDFVNKSAAKYGLDPQMVKAIMKTESDFRNKTVSHAGARGLMQVMPVVWSEIEKKYDMGWKYSTDVFEPEKNIEVACAYLAWLRYDFLPRHFEAYERDPAAPLVLVRDKDRGVPDRPTPRIVAQSARSATAAIEVAVATEDGSKTIKSAIVTEPRNESEKTPEKSGDMAEKENSSKSQVEITDTGSKSVIKQVTASGKSQVEIKALGSKAVTITFSNNRKPVATRKPTAKDRDELEKTKRPSVAKASSRNEESHGG